jgi:hypothetical protein
MILAEEIYDYCCNERAKRENVRSVQSGGLRIMCDGVKENYDIVADWVEMKKRPGELGGNLEEDAEECYEYLCIRKGEKGNGNFVDLFDSAKEHYKTVASFLRK